MPSRNICLLRAFPLFCVLYVLVCKFPGAEVPEKLEQVPLEVQEVRRGSASLTARPVDIELNAPVGLGMHNRESFFVANISFNIY